MPGSPTTPARPVTSGALLLAQQVILLHKRPFQSFRFKPGWSVSTRHGWSGYAGAPGIDHDPYVAASMAAHIILPWTHRVFANLKPGRSASTTARTRHAAFRSLLGIAVARMPTTYNMLIEPKQRHKPY